MPMITASGAEKGDLNCSFCGKGTKEVTHIIAGPTVYICNECVALCDEIIDEKASGPKPSAVPYAVGSEIQRIGNVDGAVGIGEVVSYADGIYTVNVAGPAREEWSENEVEFVRSAEDIAKDKKAEADEKARLERNVKRAEEIRTKADTVPDVILRGLVLGFAYELGYEAPKPGLSPEELATVVRLARAAPTDDVEAYVKKLRDDASVWDRASRQTVDIVSAAAWMSGLLGMGSYLLAQSKLWGGKKP